MLITSQNIQNIIVFIPNKPFFGAMLVQFPFFLTLRHSFPKAKIYICANYDEAKLFLDYELVDDIFFYSKKVEKVSFSIQRLNALKPDLLINLRHKSEKVHWYCQFIRARIKISFTPKLSVFHRIYFDTIPFQNSTYIAFNYLRVLEKLGLDITLSFELFKQLGHKHIKNKRFLAQNNIVLMAGGGEGEYKRWGIQNFLEFCKLIQQKYSDSHLIFILGNSEKQFIPEIQKCLLPDTYSLLISASIYELIHTVQQANLVVANDCGPSHIAQMCQTNYISIWGWLEKRSPLEIMGLWYLPTPNSMAILPPYPKTNIKDISPRQIQDYASIFLKE